MFFSVYLLCFFITKHRLSQQMIKLKTRGTCIKLFIILVQYKIVLLLTKTNFQQTNRNAKDNTLKLYKVHKASHRCRCIICTIDWNLLEQSFRETFNFLVNVFNILYRLQLLTHYCQPQGITRGLFPHDFFHLAFRNGFTISLKHVCHNFLHNRNLKEKRTQINVFSLYVNATPSSFYKFCLKYW